MLSYIDTAIVLPMFMMSYIDTAIVLPPAHVPLPLKRPHFTYYKMNDNIHMGSTIAVSMYDNINMGSTIGVSNCTAHVNDVIH
jgi:hypothetical protein